MYSLSEVKNKPPKLLDKKHVQRDSKLPLSYYLLIKQLAIFQLTV